MKQASLSSPITWGILGGGQLGRMSALAASQLGIKTHIYCPETASPAAEISAYNTVDSYENEKSLKAFAESVDVISYEFENIPVETVLYLKNIREVYPGDKLLEISQNRLKEKDFLNSIHIPTARYAPVLKALDIKTFMQEFDFPHSIIKTTRFGYDGKGQVFQKDINDYEDSWNILKTDEAIAEEVIDFLCEISVVVARDQFGSIEAFPPVRNTHKNHILHTTQYPASLDPALLKKAVEMAHDLAREIDLIGVCALELFITKDNQILANEIAPRPHNSGHWTIDACAVSQFEQHVRSVCGLPVAKIEPMQQAEMINLIGDDINQIDTYLNMPNACIHLYGKDEIREGRKMGHVTILKEN